MVMMPLQETQQAPEDDWMAELSSTKGFGSKPASTPGSAGAPPKAASLSGSSKGVGAKSSEGSAVAAKALPAKPQLLSPAKPQLSSPTKPAAAEGVVPQRQSDEVQDADISDTGRLRAEAQEAGEDEKTVSKVSKAAKFSEVKSQWEFQIKTIKELPELHSLALTQSEQEGIRNKLPTVVAELKKVKALSQTCVTNVKRRQNTSKLHWQLA